MPAAFRCMNTGCPSRHAVHHEEKTLTSDTSPLRSALARPSVRHLTGGSANSGTGFLISAEGIALGSRFIPQARITAMPKKAVRGTRKKIRPGQRCTLSDADPLVARIGPTLMVLAVGAGDRCHRRYRISSTDAPATTVIASRPAAALTTSMANS